jgi:hypothetical protein
MALSLWFHYRFRRGINLGVNSCESFLSFIFFLFFFCALTQNQLILCIHMLDFFAKIRKYDIFFFNCFGFAMVFFLPSILGLF